MAKLPNSATAAPTCACLPAMTLARRRRVTNLPAAQPAPKAGRPEAYAEQDGAGGLGDGWWQFAIRRTGRVVGKRREVVDVHVRAERRGPLNLLLRRTLDDRRVVKIEVQRIAAVEPPHVHRELL